MIHFHNRTTQKEAQIQAINNNHMMTAIDALAHRLQELVQDNKESVHEISSVANAIQYFAEKAKENGTAISESIGNLQLHLLEKRD